MAIQQFGGPKTRLPALTGRLMFDVYRGRVRVRSWPRKRTRPLHPKTQEQIAWFKEAQFLNRYTIGPLAVASREIVEGTALYPRDIRTMSKANSFVTWSNQFGVTRYPLAFRDAVSESLDAIGQAEGLILVRGKTLWEPLAPGQAGLVLTSQGPGAMPAWQPGGGGGSNLSPPAASAFPTWINQSSATVADSPQGALVLSNAGNPGGVNATLRARTLQSPPKTYTAYIRQQFPNVGGQGSALWLRDSAVGNAYRFALIYDATANESRLAVQRMNASLAFQSNLALQNIQPTEAVWLQITDNGTTFTFSVSGWGGAFQQFAQENRTAHLANPDQIAIGASINALGTQPWAMACLHYDEA